MRKLSVKYCRVTYSWLMNGDSFSQLCDRIYTIELENKNKVAGINITEN
jgi:hypothetical protein